MIGNVVGNIDKINGIDIVSRGSNANGNWIRLYDGTQICWFTKTVSMALSYHSGYMYFNNYQWTFPIAFSEYPAVSCGRFLWGTGGAIGSVYGRTTTVGQLRGAETVSRPTAASTKIEAMAIGKWK